MINLNKLNSTTIGTTGLLWNYHISRIELARDILKELDESDDGGISPGGGVHPIWRGNPSERGGRKVIKQLPGGWSSRTRPAPAQLHKPPKCVGET